MLNVISLNVDIIKFEGGLLYYNMFVQESYSIH